MISVIIPTRNRVKLLNNLLNKIKSQDLKQSKFEVLVIDNNSEDETKNLVKNFVGIKNLKYFLCKELGLHEARHLGIKKAKGKILVFCDDDIIPQKSWLKYINKNFENKNIFMLGGNILPKFESQPPKWLEKTWARKKEGKYLIQISLLDLGKKRKEIDPKYVFGCNFAIRKKIVLKTKGFHPDSMHGNLKKFSGDGENSVADYIRENNLVTLFDPRVSVFHWINKNRLTKKYFYQRCFIEGIANSYKRFRKERKLAKKKKRSVLYNGLIRKILINYFDIKKVINMGFRDGFIFHQKELAGDNKLQQWVLKESYLS